MGRAAGALRLEIDEGAVERVAGGAGRHRGLQGGAVEAARDLRRHGGDRGRDCVQGLAVAGVGDAFAAPAVAAVGQLRHHHGSLGLGAAADREGAGDRPALDLRDQRDGRQSKRPAAWASMV